MAKEGASCGLLGNTRIVVVPLMFLYENKYTQTV